MEITEGQPAPAFDMATADGGRVSSADLKGRPYVLYFYPKATPRAAPRKARTSPPSPTTSPRPARP